MEGRGWNDLSWMEKISQRHCLPWLLEELPAHDLEFTLVVAASRGDNPALVKELLAMGVSPSTVSHTATPLYACIILGMPNSQEIARLLLKAGADPDVGTDLCTTMRPLVYLATSEVSAYQIAVGLELLRFGATPVKNHERGRRPCQPWYVKARNGMAACLLAKRATERALAKRGVHKDVIPMVGAMVWDARLK